MNERILVIDDEAQLLHAIKRYFTREGFIVDCATELEEAEALLAHLDYRVVIADLSLSEHSGTEGLEIIRFVRSHQRNVGVILLTGHASDAAEREALRRGCNVLLHKPWPLSELALIATGLMKGVAAC